MQSRQQIFRYYNAIQFQQKQMRSHSSLLRIKKQSSTDASLLDIRVESFHNGLGKSSKIAPHGYYQARGVRPLLHRPLTNPQISQKREVSELLALREEHQKKLSVNTQRQHNRINCYPFDHPKGRLYRGSSWKYEEKLGPITSRYADQKSEQPTDPVPADNRKRTCNLMGKNLRKSTANVLDQHFFEYFMRFSYRTRKGETQANPSQINQDSIIINTNIKGKTWQHFFAICDGHGPHGHQVSSFIKKSLSQNLSNIKNIEKYPRQGISEAFELTYEQLLKKSGVDMSFSGSTIVSCYLQQNRLVCANVGDSRAILGRKKESKWSGVSLSTDHKPTVEKEADRIRKMKGRVSPLKDAQGKVIGPLRVWIQEDSVPGLTITRSFGDLVGTSVGVSPIPEITELYLTSEDRIIVIGSSGLFQFLPNSKIIELLVPYYEANLIQQASDLLMSMALKVWSKYSPAIDDVTFILIFLSYDEQQIFQ